MPSSGGRLLMRRFSAMFGFSSGLRHDPEITSAAQLQVLRSKLGR
jgi:hypothetical protein